MHQAHNSRTMTELTKFGSNPGALKCWLYLPSILAPKTPLVVVLHGCTQNAGGFDHGTGWTALAERKGFAVLFPEQQKSNNTNLCFNWFEPGDTRRGSGEALSIREMISHVVEAHGIDERRVFVTGLSAGGAMANVMLATYPELFAGGAVIGGLPYGMATGVGQAFERMHGRNPPNSKKLRAALEGANLNAPSWPRISVWHGTHDQTVKSVNAEQIVEQWSGVHGIALAPDKIESVNGHTRKVWSDKAGIEAVELFLIKGMAHGVPLSIGAESRLGNGGPFMLEAGISSTARIARMWALADDRDVADAEAGASPIHEYTHAKDGLEAVIAKAMAYAKSMGHSKGSSAETERGVGKVINDALRSAGLIR